MFHLLPQMKYNDAQTALTNGEYTAAAEKFAEISSYKDAADMVEESNYRHAEALLDSDNVTAEDIAQARTLLDTLTEQTRTDDLRKSADYQEGLLLLNRASWMMPKSCSRRWVITKIRGRSCRKSRIAAYPPKWRRQATTMPSAKG
mgnify:FL=1